MKLDLGVVAVEIVASPPHIVEHIASYFCYESDFKDCSSHYRLEVKNLSEVDFATLLSQFCKVGTITQKAGYTYTLYTGPEGRLLVSSYVGCQHFIVKRQRTVTCYINEDDDESLMVPIRVLREIMLQEHENQGAVLVHASAVVVDGKAVMFVGDSGAGKSTVAFSACTQGAHYLSNDKCILDQQLNAYSFPMAVRLAVPTVECVIGTLSGVMPRFDSPTDIFLNQEYRRWGNQHKVVLTVRDYCRLSGASQVLKSTINKLVLPSITLGYAVFEKRPLDGTARSVLNRNISVSDDRSGEDDWLDLVRLSKEDKQLNKSRIIEKLLSGKGLTIKFSTDQLKVLYDAVKSS
ncbi:hypothetical protein [Pseudomonas syringae]|uniref:hypothetical protein n=1 Tax=Pseudomonas syringae TaxID=317 RepID=UPI000CD1F70B|nr:hypothetical protein [Pseudomonas syringae]MBS7422891.1 hypothetical protein [Pseudomonas syringae]MBS7434628.1 hypothetical protein [Pseudomonas syringae]MCF5737170.1 hypothetical protein [Pseudomonas syringae]MCF5742663.1 hypothetical protein [Pseudomonas syringae]MCF5753012.1 hypothetical protein [Pseudomonas syringae]